MSTAAVAEAIKKTTQATLDALNNWDYDALVAVRADNFVFQGLPRSLQQPALDNDGFKDLWFNFMTPAFTSFKIEPMHMTHDAEALKSTMYGTVSTTTSAGLRTCEIVQMFSFHETGEKMLRLDELFDSKVYLEMIEEMK